MTAEEIQNVRFAKAWQGYDVREVDAFLDKCAEETAELMRKMEILADKVLEYRQKEADNIYSERSGGHDG